MKRILMLISIVGIDYLWGADADYGEPPDIVTHQFSIQPIKPRRKTFARSDSDELRKEVLERQHSLELARIGEEQRRIAKEERRVALQKLRQELADQRTRENERVVVTPETVTAKLVVHLQWFCDVCATFDSQLHAGKLQRKYYEQAISLATHVSLARCNIRYDRLKDRPEAKAGEITSKLPREELKKLNDRLDTYKYGESNAV